MGQSGEGSGGEGCEGKGENNFKKKIYYECACQVYECQDGFGAKPGNSAVKKLKG